jgi:hypothetical protein
LYAGTLQKWSVFPRDRVLQEDEDIYLASLPSMMGIQSHNLPEAGTLQQWNVFLKD